MKAFYHHPITLVNRGGKTWGDVRWVSISGESKTKRVRCILSLGKLAGTGEFSLLDGSGQGKLSDWKICKEDLDKIVEWANENGHRI